jgi:hypothetical protein
LIIYWIHDDSVTDVFSLLLVVRCVDHGHLIQPGSQQYFPPPSNNICKLIRNEIAVNLVEVLRHSLPSHKYNQTQPQSVIHHNVESHGEEESRANNIEEIQKGKFERVVHTRVVVCTPLANMSYIQQRHLMPTRFHGLI